MDALIIYPLSQLAHPPALGPRRRANDPAAARTLDSWFRSALDMPAETRVELSEWVSIDSRTVPHRTACSSYRKQVAPAVASRAGRPPKESASPT